MNIWSTLSRYKPMVLLLAFFLLIAVYVQFQKPFGWDELEHIHSSFLISTGEVPYRDFFQHHHPLAWYLYAPLFFIFSDKIMVLWAIKIISIFIGLGNLFILYLITGFYNKSQHFRIIAIILSVTSVIFIFNEMEIRPDNLMLTFILTGYYFLLHHFQNPKQYNLPLAGVALGLSFLFLQKAIIFIAIFNAILVLEGVISRLYKKSIRDIAVFNASLAGPILLFLAAIFSLGIWEQYFFYNWTLNTLFDDVFSIARTFKEFTWLNTGFFLILIASIAYIAFYFKRAIYDQSLRILLMTGLLYTLSLLTITRSPYSQYLLSIVFFGSILVSLVIEQNYRPGSWLRIAMISLIVFVCSFPVFFYKSFKIKDYTFAKQLDEVRTVEAKELQEKEGLRIQEDMNLFSTGHKYYWFSPEGQRTIKRLQDENKLPTSIEKI